MVVQLNQANSYRFSTDEALLDDIKQSDHVAFEYLFKRYYPRLLGYAVRFVQDEDMARDILQECFMTFWERRHLLAAVSLSSLLFLMVRNACLNYLKHSALVRHIPIDYLNELNGEEKLYSADLMLSADEPVLYEDLKRQIDDALSHLSPRSREIFLLSRFKGLKNREIAEMLGISTTAVEKHISKSLKLISDYLKDNTSYTSYLIIMYPLAELNRVKIMLEKLRISLIFINLVLLKSLSLNHRMHNLYTKFVRILEICKQFSNNLVNDQGNIVRCGPVPKFSDLEQNRKASIARNGFLITSCKNTRNKSPISYRAGNSMTAGRKPQGCAKPYARGLP